MQNYKAEIMTSKAFNVNAVSNTIQRLCLWYGQA